MLGRDGRAGEIGHNVVDTDGPECHCGKRGCLETIVGDLALLACAGRDVAPARRTSPRSSPTPAPARSGPCPRCGPSPVAGAGDRQPGEHPQPAAGDPRRLAVRGARPGPARDRAARSSSTPSTPRTRSSSGSPASASTRPCSARPSSRSSPCSRTRTSAAAPGPPPPPPDPPPPAPPPLRRPVTYSAGSPACRRARDGSRRSRGGRRTTRLADPYVGRATRADPSRSRRHAGETAE